ncbi:hypothetical protein [Streptomyces achromogenes]|uniref:hypothetical protein n=1 Tax=Streptomyces achromogenes TaxID=67255 RepID=UPI0027D8DF63|nr:hypothetical protein [Streptomyces achromogenes]
MRTERDRACPNIIAHPFRTGLGSPTDPLTSSDVADLRRFLILVADSRDARGLRYPALALLCAAVSAVLTGARSLIAISERFQRCLSRVRAALAKGSGHFPEPLRWIASLRTALAEDSSTANPEAHRTQLIGVRDRLTVWMRDRPADYR